MDLPLMVILAGVEVFLLGLALSPVPWVALLALGLMLTAAGVFFVPMIRVKARR